MISGCLDAYCEAVTKMDQNQYIMVLPNFILKYMTAVKDEERIAKYKVCIIHLVCCDDHVV